MTSNAFWKFLLKRMLVAYLGLIPSFFLAIISSSALSIWIFAIQVVLVLMGTFVMYKKYEEEILTEFSKKLGIFTREFLDKVTDSAYVFSLACIALEIAQNNEILKTRAWDKHLSKLHESLTNKVYALHERIKKGSGKEFRCYLRDFCQILDSLKEFKKEFYEMVHEIGEINFAQNFGLDAKFKDRFSRLHKEYNGFMNSLRNFSYDMEVKLGLTIDEKLIEHIYSLSELCKTIYP
jgi:hypothetical protein